MAFDRIFVVSHLDIVQSGFVLWPYDTITDNPSIDLSPSSFVIRRYRENFPFDVNPISAGSTLVNISGGSTELLFSVPGIILDRGVVYDIRRVYQALGGSIQFRLEFLPPDGTYNPLWIVDFTGAIPPEFDDPRATDWHIINGATEWDAKAGPNTSAAAADPALKTLKIRFTYLDDLGEYSEVEQARRVRNVGERWCELVTAGANIGNLLLDASGPLEVAPSELLTLRAAYDEIYDSIYTRFVFEDKSYILQSSSRDQNDVLLSLERVLT